MCLLVEFSSHSLLAIARLTVNLCEIVRRCSTMPSFFLNANFLWFQFQIFYCWDHRMLGTRIPDLCIGQSMLGFTNLKSGW